MEVVGNEFFDASASRARGREKMLRGDAAAPAGVSHGKCRGDVCAAIVGVDEIHFVLFQHVGEAMDGVLINVADLWDRQDWDACGIGTLRECAGARAGDRDLHVERAQAGGEVEHVAFGAGEDVGVGEEDDFQKSLIE